MRQSQHIRISPQLSLHRQDEDIVLSTDTGGEERLQLTSRQAEALATTLRDMLEGKVPLSPYPADAFLEGDWFVIDLDGNDLYALGTIVRADGNGGAYGYFWAPFQRSQSEPRDLMHSVTPQDAVLQARFGTAGLEGGDWHVVGRDNDFTRERWPVPPVRTGLHTMGVFDDETLNFARQLPIPDDIDPDSLGEDASFGHIALKNHLRRVVGIAS